MVKLETYETFTPKTVNRDKNAPLEYKQVKYWVTYATVFGDTENPEDYDEQGMQTEPVVGTLEDALACANIYGINKDLESGEDTDMKSGDRTIYMFHIETLNKEDNQAMLDLIKSKLK